MRLKCLNIIDGPPFALMFWIILEMKMKLR